MSFYYLHKVSKESLLLDFSNSITEGLVLAAIFDGNKRGVDLYSGTENVNASKKIVDNTMLLEPAFSVTQPSFSMPTGDKSLVIRYKTKNDASTSWPFGAPNNPRVILAEYLGNYQVYDGAWQNSGVPVEHDVYHTFIVVYKSGVGYLYKDGVLIHTWNRDTAISQIVYSAGATRKTLNVEFFYAYSRALDVFEVHSITNNPYQILKPRRKWYYFADSSGIQLLINNLSQSNTLDFIDLTQQNSLAVDDSNQSISIDNLVLSSSGDLSVSDITQSNTLQSIALSQASQLQTNNLLQSNTLQSIELTQQNILSVDNSNQSVAIDNLTLNVGGTLTIDNISQSNSLDTIALTQAGNLVVNDLSQQNAIDSIALIQANQLQVNGLLNNVTIDNIDFDFSVFLDVNNASQSVSLENIVLTQAGLLSVSDLNQSNSIDNIELTQQSTLIVSDLLHSMLLDDITLIDGAATIQVSNGTVFVLKQNKSVSMLTESKTIFIINSEMNL